jgi:hypothetical protein
MTSPVPSAGSGTSAMRSGWPKTSSKAAFMASM